MFSTDFIHVLKLTLPDLRFEWVLSLCLALALGAIFSPLFILLGLQGGIIGNMRDKLQFDPVSRQVTPRGDTSAPLDPEWIKLLAEKSSLVVSSPTASLDLDAEMPNSQDTVVPTAPTVPEDPLWSDNGISFPDDLHSIVITARLAKLLNKKAGDAVNLVLKRNTGESEEYKHPFKIAGILPEKVVPDRKLWLHEQMFEDIYQWRRGKALPALGLSAKGGGLIRPEYTGIATILEQLPSDTEYQQMLAGRLSFSRAPDLNEVTGWSNIDGKLTAVWKTINNKVSLSDLDPLISRHQEYGFSVEAVPYIENFLVTLNAGEKSVPLKVTILPKSLQSNTQEAEVDRILIGISPNDFQRLGESEVVISFASGSNEEATINIPAVLTTNAFVEEGYIAIPEEMAGKMFAARNVNAKYDSVNREFIHQNNNDYFFRAYARSIDDIEGLVQFVREHGNKSGENKLQEPISKIGQIRHLQTLSGYMTKLYLLIAIVAGISSIFAIAASVYASVERKRHDLAILQLLGIHKMALFMFPILKSQLLVIGGLVIALATYLLFGFIVNIAFVDVLPEAESLTRLSLQSSALLMVAIFLAASLASLIAASLISRIEVGEVIHQ